MLLSYLCRKCEKNFELIIKRKDKDKKQNCPTCGTETKAEEFQKSGFILKGKWFKQGY